MAHLEVTVIVYSIDRHEVKTITTYDSSNVTTVRRKDIIEPLFKEPPKIYITLGDLNSKNWEYLKTNQIDSKLLEISSKYYAIIT